MKTTEIHAKTILSPSQVYDYAINPYVGCQHACTYCYARFMKRFSGHREAWGDFVDVKINAADLLRSEIKKKPRGEVWISGVCDPYQPLDAKYLLTRQCLEILIEHDWPVIIQTRSSLVLRDLDLLTRGVAVQAGLSITTAKDEIRRIFEPQAPPIAERLRTVEELHRNKIKTYVMIAPLLPEVGELVGMLAGKVDYLIVDRLNYHYADWIYAKYGWSGKKTDDYFRMTSGRIAAECQRLGIDCRSAY